MIFRRPILPLCIAVPKRRPFKGTGTYYVSIKHPYNAKGDLIASQRLERIKIYHTIQVRCKKWPPWGMAAPEAEWFNGRLLLPQRKIFFLRNGLAVNSYSLPNPGLEPGRPRGRGILNPLRLPFRQFGKSQVILSRCGNFSSPAAIIHMNSVDPVPLTRRWLTRRVLTAR